MASRVATLPNGSDVILADDGSPSVHPPGTARSLGLSDHPNGEQALRTASPKFADLVAQSFGHPIDTAKNVFEGVRRQAAGQSLNEAQEKATGDHPYISAALSPSAALGVGAAGAQYMAQDAIKNGVNLPANFNGADYIRDNYPTLHRVAKAAEVIPDAIRSAPGVVKNILTGSAAQVTGQGLTPDEEQAVGNHPVMATAAAVPLQVGSALGGLIGRNKPQDEIADIRGK